MIYGIIDHLRHAVLTYSFRVSRHVIQLGRYEFSPNDVLLEPGEIERLSGCSPGYGEPPRRSLASSPDEALRRKLANVIGNGLTSQAEPVRSHRDYVGGVSRNVPQEEIPYFCALVTQRALVQLTK
jgi:hypothetical protein